MTSTWKTLSAAAAMAGALLFATAPIVSAEVVKLDNGSQVAGAGAAFEADEGKWFLESGDPTYRITKEGKIDFLTYRGFQRYHSECHVCHGPEGVGSTYAPDLTKSLKTMSYEDFVAVVSSGRTVKTPGGADSVMPALGDNKNVMCYLDGIYTYLKARSDGVMPRGRPKGKDSKPKALGESEDACIDG